MPSVRSLRGRVALWMVAAASLSLAVFTIAAYVVVRVEERIERRDPAIADEATRRQVLTPLAIAAPIGLALSIGGALWLSRRALAPLDRMIAALHEITVEKLDQRIDVPARDDELRALAMVAADASHELRTPLAAITSELEVALRRPRSPAEWQQSAQTSLDELRRLARVTDSLLRFAQADAARWPRSDDVELAALVDDVTEMHAAAARAAGVELAACGAADVHV